MSVDEKFQLVILTIETQIEIYIKQTTPQQAAGNSFR